MSDRQLDFLFRDTGFGDTIAELVAIAKVLDLIDELYRGVGTVDRNVARIRYDLGQVMLELLNVPLRDIHRGLTSTKYDRLISGALQWAYDTELEVSGLYGLVEKRLVESGGALLPHLPNVGAWSAKDAFEKLKDPWGKELRDPQGRPIFRGFQPVDMPNRRSGGAFRGGSLWSGSPILGTGGGGAKGLPSSGSSPDRRQFGGAGSGSGSGGGSPGDAGGGSGGQGGASSGLDGGGGGTGTGGGQKAVAGSVAYTPEERGDGTQRPAWTWFGTDGAWHKTYQVPDQTKDVTSDERPGSDDASETAPHRPYHLGLYKGPEIAPPLADSNVFLATPLWLQVQGTGGGSSAPEGDRGGDNPRFLQDPRLIFKPNPDDTSGGGGGDPRVFVYKPNPEEDGGGSGGGVGGPCGRVDALARAAAATGGAGATRAQSRTALSTPTVGSTVRRARLQ